MQRAQAYQYGNYQPYVEPQITAPQPKAMPRKKTNTFSAKDKKTALVLLVLCGIIGIMCIATSAFAATLNYKINELEAQNKQIQNEIAETEIQIQQEVSLSSLEKKATEELGMEHPTSDQIVYIVSE